MKKIGLDRCLIAYEKVHMQQAKTDQLAVGEIFRKADSTEQE